MREMIIYVHHVLLPARTLLTHSCAIRTNTKRLPQRQPQSTSTEIISTRIENKMLPTARDHSGTTSAHLCLFLRHFFDANLTDSFAVSISELSQQELILLSIIRAASRRLYPCYSLVCSKASSLPVISEKDWKERHYWTVRLLEDYQTYLKAIVAMNE